MVAPPDESSSRLELELEDTLAGSDTAPEAPAAAGALAGSAASLADGAAGAGTLADSGATVDGVVEAGMLVDEDVGVGAGALTGAVAPVDPLDAAGPADPLVPFAYPTLALPLAAFFAVAAAPCPGAAATLDILDPALSRSAVAEARPTASATAPPRCWLFLDMSSPDLVSTFMRAATSAGGYRQAVSVAQGIRHFG